MNEKLRTLLAELKTTVSKVDELKNEIRTLMEQAEHEASKPERWMPDENTDKAYGIEISPNGTIRIPEITNPFGDAIKIHEDNTNCFRTETFALDVAEKIKLTLELATLKEWLCPTYYAYAHETNWIVRKNFETDEYEIVCLNGIVCHDIIDIMFDKASAIKVCEIMNKRYRND